jgi:hypothetical protein
VIWFGEFTENMVAAVPPNVTLVAPLKLLPEIITPVPPPVGPDEGTTPLTAGAALALKVK